MSENRREIKERGPSCGEREEERRGALPGYSWRAFEEDLQDVAGERRQVLGGLWGGQLLDVRHLRTGGETGDLTQPTAGRG